MIIRFAPHAVALAAVLVGCSDSSRPDVSNVQFDSAHSIALDTTIAAGREVSSNSEPSILAGEIREQLYYTIGQLNGLDGGALDMRRTEISVDGVTPRADGLFDVEYSAKLFVAWPKEQAFPADYTFILPARADITGLVGFFNRYGADEHGAKLCLDDGAHEVEQSLMWYYYRPLKVSCALANPALDEKDVVARVDAHFALSTENTEGKSPEYAKVWEDGTLNATLIFGKYEAGATETWDAGVSAYRATYQALLAQYGQPATTNLPAGALPDVAHDDVHLTFAVPAGTLDVNLLLVDGIRQVDQAFRDKYSERTKISDYVSYSGHSGLGANIRALTRMGSFVADQYQIFLVNGCDTFAYVDGSLRDAHQTANPAFGPNKFFDIITNAMPSFFHMNATSNLAVIDALVGKTQTYREILAGFDESQRANVTGEEDNGESFDAPIVLE
jgi:hypothetical protein